MLWRYAQMLLLRLVLFLACLFPLYAAFDASIVGTGTYFAILRVRDFSGTCTIDLHEYTGSLNPVHPDWNAAADTSHATTTISGNNKYIQLGHSSNNRALKADQAYFVNVLGCGGTKTVFFHTKSAVLGAISPFPVGQDLDNYYKAAWPSQDWDYISGPNKWYTDPKTGIPIKRIPNPEDFTWSDKSDQTITRWAGATSNWTNTSNIVNGSTSTAQTTGTDPIYLYPARLDPWDGTQPTIHNVGVQIWAQCINGTVGSDDCKLVMHVHDTPGSVPSGATLIEIPATATFAAVTN